MALIQQGNDAFLVTVPAEGVPVIHYNPRDDVWKSTIMGMNFLRAGCTKIQFFLLDFSDIKKIKGNIQRDFDSIKLPGEDFIVSENSYNVVNVEREKK